ncbi:aminotransferase class IV [Sulfurimonas sp. HSL1-6]|uniref:aminotransferase class IV n=1 Tax=Thiomicrolovo immobilis TaxID=3131935 RepID=UPI0031F8E891
MPFLETILAEEGRFPYLPWHQQRLERTLGRHGIPNLYDLEKRLEAPETGRWRCRVQYDEQTFTYDFLPYTPRIITSLQPVTDETITYRDKTTERERLDRLFARRGSADDVLIVQAGLITDTTIANVACFIGGRWLTPKRPLLEGTARARLIEAGKLTCADITLDAARGAERVAVMNALSGFVEVSGGILPPIN